MKTPPLNVGTTLGVSADLPIQGGTLYSRRSQTNSAVTPAHDPPIPAPTGTGPQWLEVGIPCIFYFTRAEDESLRER
jgi:hypothetical protein